MTFLLATAFTAQKARAGTNVLGIEGTSFTLNGEPFAFTGVSFFNAIYNPAFNRSVEERLAWIEKFRSYGINVLRVWGQWDNRRGFVDACDTCALHHPDGRLREEHVARLQEIVAAADRAGTVILLAFFARESWNEGIRLEFDGSALKRTRRSRVSGEVEPADGTAERPICPLSRILVNLFTRIKIPLSY